mgnify:CR=1 FL=1
MGLDVRLFYCTRSILHQHSGGKKRRHLSTTTEFSIIIDMKKYKSTHISFVYPENWTLFENDGDEVSGEDDAEGTAGIEEAGDVLDGAPEVQHVDHGDEGDERTHQ